MNKTSNIIIFKPKKPVRNIIVRKTHSFISNILLKMIKIYTHGLEMIDDVLVISYDD